MTTAPTNEPVSIAELFARDPLENTDADITAIIKHMRDNRVKFKVGGDKTAGRAPKKNANQKKLEGLDLDIKL